MDENLTKQEAYAAMYYFLWHHYEKSNDHYISGLLTGMSVLQDGKPFDAAMESDWDNAIKKTRMHQVDINILDSSEQNLKYKSKMKTKLGQSLRVLEAYIAMFSFFDFYKIDEDDYLARLLRSMRLNSDGKPVDPLNSKLWKEAVEKSKKNEIDNRFKLFPPEGGVKYSL